MTQSTPDEAQAENPPLQDAKITSFGIKLYVGASIEINGRDWVKVGSEGSTTWDAIPDAKTLKQAAAFIQGAHLEPAIEEILVHHAKASVEKHLMG